MIFRKVFVPQNWVLTPFGVTFHSCDINKLSHFRKLCRKAFRIIGGLVVVSFWAVLIFEIAFNYHDSCFGYLPKGNTFLNILSSLPDTLIGIRGVLVITIVFSKHPRKWRQLSEGCQDLLRRHFPNPLLKFKYSRWRKFCLLCFAVSSLLVFCQEQDVWVDAFGRSTIYIELDQLTSNNSNMSDVNQGSTWLVDFVIQDFTLWMYSFTVPHLLADQTCIVLILYCLFVADILEDIGASIKALLALDPSSTKVSHEYAIGHEVIMQTSNLEEVLRSYDEVRRFWQQLNTHFMLIFGVSYGSEVLSMLGQVVSLVGLSSTSALLTPAHVGSTVMAALAHGLLAFFTALPLTLVNTRDLEIGNELFEYRRRALFLLKRSQSKPLEATLGVFEERQKRDPISFHLWVFYDVTLCSVLTSLTLVVTFALVAREIFQNK